MEEIEFKVCFRRKNLDKQRRAERKFRQGNCEYISLGTNVHTCNESLQVIEWTTLASSSIKMPLRRWNSLSFATITTHCNKAVFWAVTNRPGSQ
jgi:hypothetical protein